LLLLQQQPQPQPQYLNYLKQLSILYARPPLETFAAA
jgi:hypothetical protein